MFFLQISLLSLFLCEISCGIFHGIKFPKDQQDSSAESVVEINQGSITGIVDFSRNGRAFMSFKGIPFGKVPERFNNPIPADGWNGTRDAKEYGPPCPQVHIYSHAYSGVEDCLTLDVFVPKIDNPNATLPVMFHIHGGAFVMGATRGYQPHFFMDEDVIYVSAAYRLGAFGFLNAGIKGASGNQALKDLVLALKWVQENIKAFGGSPEKVTIFGVSAGGALVSHLVASPMAQGLFRGAIAQSGTATIGWAQWPDPEFLEVKKLAHALDCPTSNKQFMMDCLRKIKPDMLARATDFKDNVWFERSATPVFAPSIETFAESKDDPNVFLTEPAEKVAEEGRHNKVPLMIGFTSHEGLSLHAAPILVQPEKTKMLNERWGKILPEALFYWTLAKDPCKVNGKMKKLYFQDQPVSFQTADGLTKMYSDGAFQYPARKVALNHAQFAPVYLYNFTKEVRHSFIDIFRWWDVYKPGTVLKSPAHPDDIQFLHSHTNIFPNVEKDSPEYEFSTNLVKLYVSFARDSKPTHTWGSLKEIPALKGSPKDDKNVTYLRIDDELSVEPEPEDFYERMQMLDSICRDDFDYCVPLKK